MGSPNGAAVRRAGSNGGLAKVFHRGGLALGACLGMKNIGKPCAGKPHARFDEGGQAKACPLLYLFLRARPDRVRCRA